MPAQMSLGVIRGATIFACMIWGWSVPSFSEAETAILIPRASSETDKHLQEETLYLKEETVSIASRYEQPISRAPSDVYVITEDDIRHSGATDIPTLLRRVPGMEVMQMNAVDLNVSGAATTNSTPTNSWYLSTAGRSTSINPVKCYGNCCLSH